MFNITSLGKGTTELGQLKFGRIIPIVLFVLFFWVWYANPLVVSVTGTGEVAAEPNQAMISFVIASTSASPNDAIASVNTKANQIKAALGAFGIIEEDITQSQVNVIPPALAGVGATGYSATISMITMIDDYKNANDLIATLYGNGVTYVSQPILSVKDVKSLENKAYNLAMKDASVKANKMAFSNWKLFKKKITITQTTTSPSTSTTSKSMENTQTETGEAVFSDTFKVSSIVSVTYKMW